MLEFQSVDPIPVRPDFERVVDGFLYDFRLRPMCLSYLPLALGHENLEVRAAYGDRKPRYVVFPKDPRITISPVGYYEEQVPVAPGSLIWGIGVACAEANLTQLENYSLRITDLQTGVEFWSEFMPVAPLEFSTGEGNPYIFPEPHIVLATGTLLMEIGARDANGVDAEAIAFSVILFVSEPVQFCDPAMTSAAAVGKGGN
jgi:hypothetical protein